MGPMPTSCGDLVARRRSAAVRESPRSNMMIAGAMGRPAGMSAESPVEVDPHMEDSPSRVLTAEMKYRVIVRAIVLEYYAYVATRTPSTRVLPLRGPLRPLKKPGSNAEPRW